MVLIDSCHTTDTLNYKNLEKKIDFFNTVIIYLHTYIKYLPNVLHTTKEYFRKE